MAPLVVTEIQEPKDPSVKKVPKVQEDLLVTLDMDPLATKEKREHEDQKELKDLMVSEVNLHKMTCFVYFS